MSLHSLAQRAVQRLRLPPWVTGYRHFRCAFPEDLQGVGDRYRELAHARTMDYPLPINVSHRSDLSSEQQASFPHTFHDVPSLRVPASYALTLRNCTVVRHTSEWGNDFYAIITEDQASFSGPGIGFSDAHRANYRNRGSCRSFEHGTWFLGMWNTNYYLWHTTYLPKLIAARRLGIEDALVFPDGGRLKPFQKWAIESLDMSPHLVLPADETAWTFRELTVLQTYPYGGRDLCEFRDRVCLPSDVVPTVRSYVSREKAKRRHLTNETEIRATFESRGWETICMEDLPFPEQVSRMQRSRAIAGLHGAGFANMVYMPPGSDVFEISVRERPNANFYALACAMGHRYWVVFAETAGRRDRVIHDDATVEVPAISAVLDRMDSGT